MIYFLIVLFVLAVIAIYYNSITPKPKTGRGGGSIEDDKPGEEDKNNESIV